MDFYQLIQQMLAQRQPQQSMYRMGTANPQRMGNARGSEYLDRIKAYLASMGHGAQRDPLGGSSSPLPGTTNVKNVKDMLTR